MKDLSSPETCPPVFNNDELCDCVESFFISRLQDYLDNKPTLTLAYICVFVST